MRGDFVEMFADERFETQGKLVVLRNVSNAGTHAEGSVAGSTFAGHLVEILLDQGFGAQVDAGAPKK